MTPRAAAAHGRDKAPFCPVKLLLAALHRPALKGCSSVDLAFVGEGKKTKARLEIVVS